MILPLIKLSKEELPDRAVGAMVDEASRRMASRNGTDPSKPDDLTVIAYRPS